MKFYGGVWDGQMNKQLNFSDDLDHYAECPIRN